MCALQWIDDLSRVSCVLEMGSTVAAPCDTTGCNVDKIINEWMFCTETTANSIFVCSLRVCVCVMRLD